MDPTTLADLLGPIAMQDYEGATEAEQAHIRSWAPTLATLDDPAFFGVCKDAVIDGVTSESQRRTAPTPYIKAAACMREARRRHVAAGHEADCGGDNIYQQAFNEAQRDFGFNPGDPSDCTCGKGGE